MGTSELFLDAGQSAVRARLRHDAGAENWTLPKVDTSRSIVDQIIKSIEAVLQQTDERPWRVSISSTALSDDRNSAKEIFAFAAKHNNIEQLLLAHDSMGGYLACLGAKQGAVTAVGTGVVTLGVGPKGFSRVDGWGNIIGDAGSGFWIGRAGLDAAMRSFDGRGPKTRLQDLATRSFDQLEEAYLDLQADPNRVARVASFAKEIVELSAADLVAKQIVNQAIEELSISLSAALKNVGFSSADKPSIGWTGSVATNPIISELLQRGLIENWPNAEFVNSKNEPIDGVELMAGLANDHPLSSRITSVSTSI